MCIVELDYHGIEVDVHNGSYQTVCTCDKLMALIKLWLHKQYIAIHKVDIDFKATEFFLFTCK